MRCTHAVGREGMALTWSICHMLPAGHVSGRLRSLILHHSASRALQGKRCSEHAHHTHAHHQVASICV